MNKKVEGEVNTFVIMSERIKASVQQNRKPVHVCFSLEEAKSYVVGREDNARNTRYYRLKVPNSKNDGSGTYEK